jgi:DNA-binding SARP family transcriptional activator/tetratricopeptide (TPR) repeat protein
MRFQALGPLRVWNGAGWSGIGAPHQRVVLAVLLTEAGRVVSTDRLMYEIWGERPPRTAAHAVQVYVQRLRRVVGAGREGPLSTRGRGYQMLTEDGDLDTAVFDRLVDTGTRSLAEGRLEPGVAALSDALRLWQGPALADVPSGPTVAAEVDRLEQRRLTAAEARMGALLDLGHHADVVDDLRRLAERNLLRERLHGHLMVALYRCGRRSDALAAYQRARTALVTELGVEPGPYLRELQRAILAGAPVPDGPGAGLPLVTRLVPAQLPPDVAGFTGRVDAVSWLDRWRATVDGAAGVAVAMVTGPAGVGKTALATRWSHRLRDAFPDGQLYVNLRGHAVAPPVAPVEALAGFLSSLGLAADRIPSTVDQAAAVYRSLLADRRVLVVLDDARDADQVRPLLPGGAGPVVIVTSRNRLHGLVARDGARRLDLDILSPADAEGLLVGVVGADRVRGQAEATAELARLCGRLPLALRIAAANLVGHPGTTVADYAARLATGDRLALLEVPGDPGSGVRVAFGQSYTGLPAPARRLFRRLGVTPCLDLTAATAGRLLDPDDPAADAVLDTLATAHLVTEHAPGRYAVHDLLRLYAAERAAAEEDPTDATAALDRLFGHYLDAVHAAAARLFPQILRVPHDEREPHDEDSASVGADDAAASAWLDAERPNLVATVRHCAAHGPRSTAWRLADALRGYLYHGRHSVDWAAVADAGVAAADADGDARARAATRISVALHHLTQGRHQSAIETYTEALALARQAAWVEGESAALGNLGSVHTNLGRFVEAAQHSTQALELDRRMGWTAGRASKVSNIGIACYGLGELALAADHQIEAAELFRAAGARGGEAATLAMLGEVRHAQGRLDDATRLLTRALRTHRDVGDRHTEGDTTRALAAVHLDGGRPARAGELVRSALALAREVGDRRLEAATLTTQARVDHRSGRLDDAVAGHLAAATLAAETGDRYVEAEALTGLAEAYRATGAAGEAAEAARRALELADRGGYRRITDRLRGGPSD